MLKRQLTLCGLMLLLTACGSRIDSMQQTIEHAVFGPPDIELTSEQIKQYRYPIQYLRLDNGPQIVLGLAFDDKGLYKWQSGAGEILVTQRGRAIQTQGVALNLTHVAGITNDPLLCLTALEDDCSLSWQGKVTIGEGFHQQTMAFNGRFTQQAEETVRLGNGKTVQTEHWVEHMTSADGQQHWRNHFWLEQHSGRVVKSRQTPHPGWKSLQLLEVKAYRPDLTPTPANPGQGAQQ